MARGIRTKQLYSVNLIVWSNLLNSVANLVKRDHNRYSFTSARHYTASFVWLVPQAVTKGPDTMRRTDEASQFVVSRLLQKTV
jgi:hypothetical protein